MVAEQIKYTKIKINNNKQADKRITTKTYTLFMPGNLVSSYILHSFQYSLKQLFNA